MKHYLRKYNRERRLTDIQATLQNQIKARLNGHLRFNHKYGIALEEIGCPADRLKEHLQSQFHTGMAWENYGKVWNIDHKFPLSRVDLTQKEQRLRVCHFSNLQPLFVEENSRKGNRI